MALQSDVKLENNFGEVSSFKKAYVRIDHLSGNKAQIEITYTISKAKGERILASGALTFVPQFEQENLLAQGYAELKKLPEFCNSLDV